MPGAQTVAWARLKRISDSAVRAGARVSDLGYAVQHYVEANGYSVVREFVGHGIGTKLHEEPQIPNYGQPGQGPRLAEGMVLAIEPMVNIGSATVKVLKDGWTAVTSDGNLSAHFEHTVAVTAEGAEVLTRRSSESNRDGDYLSVTTTQHASMSTVLPES